MFTDKFQFQILNPDELSNKSSMNESDNNKSLDQKYSEIKNQNKAVKNKNKMDMSRQMHNSNLDKSFASPERQI